jgi:hypothetical protein
LLQVTEAMYGMLERFNQQGVAQPQPQAAAPPPQTADFGDDDYVSGRQVKQYLAQGAQQYVDPRLQGLAQANANLALRYVQGEHKDVFEKYGPEIHGLIASVPPDARTVDMLTNIVDIVRGKHVRELAESMAQQRLQELQQQVAPSGMRSNGAPLGGLAPTPDQTGLRSDTVPAQWRAKAEKVGLTEKQIDDFCRANSEYDGLSIEQAREKFFKQFEGNVMSDKAVARV